MKLKLFFLAGAAACGGCYSVNTVQNADSAAQVHVVADKRVVWDRTLEGKLQLGQIIDTLVTGNLRKIQMDVTNRYAYHLEFSYRIEWFDLNGMKLEGPGTIWKHLHLEAHETSTIAAVADNPKAHDFVIKFQESSGNNSVF